MQPSPRTHVPGTVTRILMGVVTADVVVEVAGQEVVVGMTKSSVEQMGLQVGTAVTVLIQAIDVMLATDA